MRRLLTQALSELSERLYGSSRRRVRLAMRGVAIMLLY
jgi:hypothetical protein